MFAIYADGRSLKLPKSSSSGPGAPQPTMRSFLRLANINKNFPVGHSSGGSSRLDVIESKKNRIIGGPGGRGFLNILCAFWRP